MQESYPYSYSDYAITNPFEKLAISILKTGIVPKISYTQRRQYSGVITRINKYRLKNEVPFIPDYLLGIEEAPILTPVYAAGFSSDRTTEYGPKLTGYMEGVRLMSVEIGVIKMITDEKIPTHLKLEKNT